MVLSALVHKVEVVFPQLALLDQARNQEGCRRPVSLPQVVHREVAFQLVFQAQCPAEESLPQVQQALVFNQGACHRQASFLHNQMACLPLVVLALSLVNYRQRVFRARCQEDFHLLVPPVPVYNQTAFRQQVCSLHNQALYLQVPLPLAHHPADFRQRASFRRSPAESCRPAQLARAFSLEATNQRVLSHLNLVFLQLVPRAQFCRQVDYPQQGCRLPVPLLQVYHQEAFLLQVVFRRNLVVYRPRVPSHRNPVSCRLVRLDQVFNRAALHLQAFRQQAPPAPVYHLAASLLLVVCQLVLLAPVLSQLVYRQQACLLRNQEVLYLQVSSTRHSLEVLRLLVLPLQVSNPVVFFQQVLLALELDRFRVASLPAALRLSCRVPDQLRLLQRLHVLKVPIRPSPIARAPNTPSNAPRRWSHPINWRHCRDLAARLIALLNVQVMGLVIPYPATRPLTMRTLKSATSTMGTLHRALLIQESTLSSNSQVNPAVRAPVLLPLKVWQHRVRCPDVQSRTGNVLRK